MNPSFVNDDITVEIQEEPGCAVKAVVHFFPSKTLKIYESSLQQLRKEISLPGFRKGKAPAEIIKQRYEERLTKDWHRSLIDHAIKDGIAITNTRLFNNDSLQKVEVLSCSESEGARIAINYERFPSIPVISWENIKIPAQEEIHPISDDDIAKQIEHIRFFFAKWESRNSDEAVVQEDDYIILSASLASAHSQVTLFEKKRFSLQSNDLGSSIRSILIGKKIGALVEEVVKDPEITSWVQGDTITFTINDIVTPQLPELDDEFFKSIHAESLEDLQNKVTIQLKNRSSLDVKEKRLQQVEEALCAAYDFDIPASFVNKQPLEKVIREHLLNLRFVNGISDEELAEKKQTIRDEFSLKANNNMKLFFLAQQIFSQENLAISKEEMNAEIQQCAQENIQQGLSTKDMNTQEIRELIAFAKERLICKKAFEIALIKVEETPQNS
ncbi:Trigger factor [Candidatus Clavichlamydia salmonicola]|uniref:trigger factor n=1 Tax=Candidatus Clavichlamydia salmonicola TaxID=469812 RepID=UPI001890D382|nr:trigger factor [Candidatus Clavichlamydia salmonicola]MBF5050544.1 Trigger factor [Candidatus Clavichlamydia salmonicola]